jgi:hypothetical protein
MTRSSRCASPLRPSSHFFLSRVLSSPFLTPLSTGCCSDRWGDGQSSFGPYLPLEIYCESYSTPIPSSLLPFSALLHSYLCSLVLSCLLSVNLSSIISCLVWSSLLPLFFSSFHLIARPIYLLLRLPHLSMIVTLEVSILMHPAASSPF